jgi:hypothetical protein
MSYENNQRNLIFNFRYLLSGHYIYTQVGKAAGMCGYFSKPRRVREQKRLGNNGVTLVLPIIFILLLIYL